MEITFLIVGFIVFVGDSSRGVLFPALWNLCQILGGNLVDMGYLVGMFSFGRLLMTSPLSYFCDWKGHKISLILANFILVIGAILWANSYSIGDIRCLYAAQLFMGIGSGSLGVTRSFVSERTISKNRTGMLAFLTAIQYAGFTISPIFGSALMLLGRLGSTSNHYFVFALPAYFVVLMVIFCLISLQFKFQDSLTNPTIPVPATLEVSDDSIYNILQPFQDQSLASSELHPSQVPVTLDHSVNEFNHNSNTNQGGNVMTIIFSVLLLNVTMKGSIAVYETLGAQIAIEDYGMSVTNLGVMISVSGAIGFVQLLLFKSFWVKYFTDIQLVLGGIGIMILAQFVIISYSQPASIDQYVSSTVLVYAIGYPIGHTALLGLFSKIQKSGKQSIMMGWFATVGSLSRIIFPISASYIDKYIDNGPFLVILFLLAASYTGVVIIQPELVQIVNGGNLPSNEVKTDSLNYKTIELETVVNPLSEQGNHLNKKGVDNDINLNNDYIDKNNYDIVKNNDGEYKNGNNFELNLVSNSDKININNNIGKNEEYKEGGVFLLNLERSNNKLISNNVGMSSLSPK